MGRWRTYSCRSSFIPKHRNDKKKKKNLPTPVTHTISEKNGKKRNKETIYFIQIVRFSWLS